MFFISRIRHNKVLEILRDTRDDYSDARYVNLKLRSALSRIANQRTKGANATVTRMADIADEALKTQPQ